MNHTIAQTIEAVYPSDKSYSAALARHWKAANQPEKALTNFNEAARQALSNSYQQALDFATEAEGLEAHVPNLSASERALRASVQANAYYGMGQIQNAQKYFQETLAHMKIAQVPNANWQVILAVLRELGTQALHRFFPSQFLGKRQGLKADGLVLGSLLNMTVLYYNSNQPLKVLYTVLLYLNTAEKLTESEYVSPSIGYASMTYATGIVGMRSLAEYYKRLALEGLAKSDERYHASIGRALGGYAYHSADWPVAVDFISKSLAYDEKIGDVRVFEEDSQMLGNITEYMGQYDKAYAVIQRAYQQAKKRDDRHSRFFLFASMVGLHLEMDSIDSFEDLSLLKNESEAIEVFGKVFEANPSDKGVYHVLHATYALKQSQYQTVWSDVKAAAKIVQKAGVDATVNFFKLYQHLPDLSYALLKSGKLSVQEQAECLKIYKEACDWLKTYAKPVSYALPRYHLHRGWLAAHEGDGPGAEQAFGEALRHAQTKQMPFDEGLSHLALAHVASSEQKATHQERAQEVFRQLGLSRYLNQA